MNRFPLLFAAAYGIGIGCVLSGLAGLGAALRMARAL